MSTANTPVEDTLAVSVGQFPALEDKDANLKNVRYLAAEASRSGARVLVLPEAAMYHRVDASVDEGVRAAEGLDGPFATAIRELSEQYGLFIAVGMSLRPAQEIRPARALNVLLLVDQGEILHVYEKVHLYDAFRVKESDSISPGHTLPPVVTVDGFRLGFAICYDLRFPELFRLLTDQGAEVIGVSAAWARGSVKEDHWLALLRARAIENTAYVLASDESGPKSVGRSVIFDPMGLQLGDAGEKEVSLLTATVSRSRVLEVRDVVPSLANRRISVAQIISPIGAA